MDQNQSERFIELFLVFYKTQKELFEKVIQKLQDTQNTKEKEEREVLALKKEVLTLQMQTFRQLSPLCSHCLNANDNLHLMS